jgi:hypothetical protein
VPKDRHWKHRLVVVCYRLVRLVQRHVPPGARTLAGLVVMAGGSLGFLPVLGFWMMPLGAVIVVSDVPPLRRCLDRWLIDTRRRYHMDLLERSRRALPASRGL